MRTELQINQTFNDWTVIEGPIKIDGKDCYKLKCKCGHEQIFKVRYIVSKAFSKSCRACSQQRRRNQQGREYEIGTKFQNLTVLSKPHQYKGNSYYKVQCDCGHIFHTGHSTLHRKKIGTSLPYCNACFSYDKRKPKRNTMLTTHISKSKYGNLMHVAKERGISFEVTPEYLEKLWISQNKKCALSGIPLTMGISSHNWSHTTASLDRIDSNIGYVEGNVQWIHKDINYMKCDFTQEEFINYCKLISDLHANQQPS